VVEVSLSRVDRDVLPSNSAGEGLDLDTAFVSLNLTARHSNSITSCTTLEHRGREVTIVSRFMEWLRSLHHYNVEVLLGQISPCESTDVQVLVLRRNTTCTDS
jgi:hypothetical protein